MCCASQFLAQLISSQPTGAFKSSNEYPQDSPPQNCIFSYSEHYEFANEIRYILYFFGASSVNIKFIKCNLCKIEKLLKKQEIVWDFVWVYILHIFIGKHSLMLACFVAILIRPHNNIESWHNSMIVFCFVLLCLAVLLRQSNGDRLDLSVRLKTVFSKFTALVKEVSF